MSDPETSATSEAPRSFEEVVGRLEDVVATLEEGDQPLERSLAMFEEGIRLVREGARQLDAAEARVERLLAASRSGELDTEPLGGVDDEP